MTSRHCIEQLSCEVRGIKLLLERRQIKKKKNSNETEARQMLEEKCVYSKPNISFPYFALIVCCGTLIMATPTLKASVLVSAAATPETQKAASSYLLYSATPIAEKTGVEANKLEQLLKDSNHSHASDTISLKLANEVWAKMHERVESYARARAHLLEPSVRELMDKSQIGATCRQSILDTIEHLARLDDWAVLMYNSFGNFPAAGFFEGTHTSMGSYHQCVNVEANQWIGRAQYCTLKFQPVIPKRPRYHNILATIDNLANFTRKNDIFSGLAKKAHYFYYTKLRLATCMPTKCEKSDLEQLGEQIALNTYLQFQGVHCLERSGPFQPDGAQTLALTILVLMASVALLGTLVHLFKVRALFERPKRRHLIRHIDLKAQLGAARSAFDEAIAMQQEKLLLAGNHKQMDCILASPMGQSTPGAQSEEGQMGSAACSPSANKLILALIDVLLHFSIIRNGKKLFDTSTSRRQRGQSRAASLVPGMREAVAVGAISSSSSSSSSSGPSATSSSCGASSGDSSAASTVGSQSDSSSVDGRQRSNDISCVHGLRFWTISWIILGHTMQYTEWAGFGRAYQVERNITSLFLHPLLNATFSVDTFFLISGLLTTYVTWSITRGQLWRFNKFAFLISRYLRLMPQVLIVILIFIIFPLIGDGPYWRGIVQKESDNCKRNWWVSALFLQSFYRSDQICNLVTWWLSIEMFYHFISIIVIVALLHSVKRGILAALLVGGGLTAVSCYLHYANSYPPNMLPTLLQRYEIWDSIVLKYFWTPYPHAPSYFMGLMLGYVLYNRSINQLTKRQVRLGWLAFAVCYLTILFGTYHWNNNAPYSRLVSTAYYNGSQILWSLATGWAILACALGHGGWLNDFLSSPVFVPLGRATYMTYLSHMLIVMAYPAKQNLLIEPSYIVFLYIFISNLCLSYILGISLTLLYESPILHLQKLLVTGMASKFNGEEPASEKLKRAHHKQTSGAQTGTRGHHHDDDDDDDDAASAAPVNARQEDTVRVSLYAPTHQSGLPIKELEEEQGVLMRQHIPVAN